MEFKDYYKIMGVARDATQDEIKRAYRTLYKSGLTLADAKAELGRQAQSAPEVGAIVEFLATSTRGIVR